MLKHNDRFDGGPPPSSVKTPKEDDTARNQRVGGVRGVAMANVYDGAYTGALIELSNRGYQIDLARQAAHAIAVQTVQDYSRPTAIMAMPPPHQSEAV